MSKYVSLLILLDLDAVDHVILLKRFETWIGISNTDINWIKSHLEARMYVGNIVNCFWQNGRNLWGSSGLNYWTFIIAVVFTIYYWFYIFILHSNYCVNLYIFCCEASLNPLKDAQQIN